MKIENVNNLIAQHSDDAREAIVRLEDYCQQDENGETPLNVAVQSQNRAIVELLAESEEAVNFAPTIDDDLLEPTRYSVNAVFSGTNLEETEKYLRNSFGPNTCLQRTPLHVACRIGDGDAIELLISKNAALDATDLLGLTPLELCVLSDGDDDTDRFISCAVDGSRKLAVSDTALQAACPDTALYQKLIQHGALGIKARRFAFSLACALLDKDAVSGWLEQGWDASKMTNHEFNPVLEVCTSRSLTFYDHPDAPKLAAQYLATLPGGTSAIHIDNDAIMNAESLDDIEALFSEAAEQPSYELSDEERQSQLLLRLELIDMLAKHDVNAGADQDEFENLESPELRQALSEKGFLAGQGQPKPTARRKAIRDSRFTWELGGESMLLAETDPKEPTHSEPVIVRLTHNNVYGPVDGVTLSVRDGDEWHRLSLVEELMIVDGDEVERSSVTEPVYDETPWEATYECELRLDAGKQVIVIRVESEMAGLSGDISDWTVNVK